MAVVNFGTPTTTPGVAVGVPDEMGMIVHERFS
jgi:hypothetical protein